MLIALIVLGITALLGLTVVIAANRGAWRLTGLCMIALGVLNSAAATYAVVTDPIKPYFVNILLLAYCLYVAYRALECGYAALDIAREQDRARAEGWKPVIPAHEDSPAD